VDIRGEEKEAILKSMGGEESAYSNLVKRRGNRIGAEERKRIGLKEREKGAKDIKRERRRPFRKGEEKLPHHFLRKVAPYFTSNVSIGRKKRGVIRRGAGAFGIFERGSSRLRGEKRLREAVLEGELESPISSKKEGTASKKRLAF